LAAVAAAGTNEEGLKFLEENKAKEGVITLESGLQYKVLKKGSGMYSPRVGTSCKCHYAGTTPALTPNATDYADGEEGEWTEFDSSYKRGEPTSFAPNQVIKGWTEAMQLMKEGDKWEMYIPSELGYGDGGSGDKIKGGDVLIFRMELLEINGAKKRVVKCTYDNGEGCTAKEMEVYNEWKDRWSELQVKVEALMDKTSQTLKKGEHEKYMTELKPLKPVYKYLKKALKQKGEL